MIRTLLSRFSILAAALSYLALLSTRPGSLPADSKHLSEYLYSSVQNIVGTHLLIGAIALIWYLMSGRRPKTVEAVEEKKD